ncbi:MAG: hypothetical protein C4305_08700 [Thermoleophilia bacterium]
MDGGGAGRSRCPPLCHHPRPFAALTADQPGHAGAADILQAKPPTLVLSPFALAGRYKTSRVLAVDERHFRILGTRQAEALTILPGDA